MHVADAQRFDAEIAIRERLLATLAEQKMIEAEHGFQNDQKVTLRDPKAKLITFEMQSISRFFIHCNFMFPEEMLKILRKHGGAYDFKQREWVASYCRQRGIDLDPIS